MIFLNDLIAKNEARDTERPLIICKWEPSWDCLKSIDAISVTRVIICAHPLDSSSKLHEIDSVEIACNELINQTNVDFVNEDTRKIKIQINEDNLCIPDKINPPQYKEGQLEKF